MDNTCQYVLSMQQLLCTFHLKISLGVASFDSALLQIIQIHCMYSWHDWQERWEIPWARHGMFYKLREGVSRHGPHFCSLTAVFANGCTLIKGAIKCRVCKYPTIQKPPSLTLASSIELNLKWLKVRWPAVCAWGGPSLVYIHAGWIVQCLLMIGTNLFPGTKLKVKFYCGNCCYSHSWISTHWMYDQRAFMHLHYQKYGKVLWYGVELLQT